MPASSPARPDLAVFIGRFQPFHKGHLRIVEAALAQAAWVLVIVGSAEAARRPDLVPFTAEERREMILACLPPEDRRRVRFAFAPDLGDLAAWAALVRRLAADTLAELGLAPDARVSLIGCSKDRSSYYLRAFPEWEAIAVPPLGELAATPARLAFFSDDPAAVDAFLAGPARDQLPQPVIAWLRAFRAGPDYQDLVEEMAFARRYQAAWSAAPYPPVFVTADAVVIHDAHVLLIRRKGRPGRGLWALPGGFLEQDEFIRDAAVRELAEETGLQLSAEALRDCQRATQVFDAPRRDMRGRVVTHATLFQLPSGGAPPAVTAADDADAAQWVPLAQLRRDQMFGDHYLIIQLLTAGA